MFLKFLKICLLGLALGLLYPLINMQPTWPVFVIGGFGGLMVSFLYSLFELIVFKGNFVYLKLWKQLLFRVLIYTLIFCAGLSTLYTLHGFYNYSRTDIAAEEFLEAGSYLLPYIMFYSFFMAAVSQIIYVLSSIIGFDDLKRILAGNYNFTRTEKVLVAAIAFRNISTEEILSYLPVFFEEQNSEIIESEGNIILLMWKQNALKKQEHGTFIQNFYDSLQTHLNHKSHIRLTEKMPLPAIGAAFGNLVLHQTGIVGPLKIEKSGEAINNAKTALQYCISNNLNFHFKK